jgi:hypothetical protein
VLEWACVTNVSIRKFRINVARTIDSHSLLPRNVTHAMYFTLSHHSPTIHRLVNQPAYEC